MYFTVLLLFLPGGSQRRSFALARSSHGQDGPYSEVVAARAVYLLPPGPCSGAGKNRSSRTSPTASQEMAPLRAHASASSISAASSIQKPPMCSLVSVYGPS